MLGKSIASLGGQPHRRTVATAHQSRLDDPAGQQDALAIIKLLESRRSALTRLLWMKAWANAQQKRIQEFRHSPAGSSAWWSAGSGYLRLLTTLADYHAGRGRGPGRPPSLPSKDGRDVGVALARIAVRFLRTGEYLGPGPCTLPPPNPLWTQEEANALADEKGWGDPVRDLLREEVQAPLPGLKYADLRVPQAANHFRDVLLPLLDHESALPDGDDDEAAEVRRTLRKAFLQSLAYLVTSLVRHLVLHEGRVRAADLGIEAEVLAILRPARDLLVEAMPDEERVRTSARNQYSASKESATLM